MPISLFTAPQILSCLRQKRLAPFPSQNYNAGGLKSEKSSRLLLADVPPAKDGRYF